ncbi:MAG: hypothetical protein FWD84_00045 [Oscillospiraceae bacterium]|nr:hypothetical protein [Oscillospiraceae bacterium]
MATLKRLHTRLDQMTNPTYFLLRFALLLSTIMTLCALVLYFSSGGLSIAGFAAYRTAQDLISLSAVILFIAAIGSAIVEELTMRT